jgi:amphi-Trp domain-containing protein
MPDETLFDAEQALSRADVATYLRTVADKLESTGTLEFSAANQSATVEVPDHVQFEIDVERADGGDSAEISLEFELEWYETEDGTLAGPGSLEIE